MAKISNRVAYGAALAELGALDPRVVVLDADVAKATCTAEFAKRYPTRFFEMGIAEQNMMSVAAGLATMGFIPFVSTFAVFATMRAVEQFRNMVAYPNLPVKVVATHAGIENGGDGATHQSVEDIAIMRAIPNVKVIVPSDHISTKKIIHALPQIEGPVYVRLGRSENEAIYGEDFSFVPGKAVELMPGEDLAILAVGDMVEKAVAAGKILREKGIKARIVDVLTVKPLDEEMVLKAARETRGIITVEDHNIYGGLGSAVAEVLARRSPQTVTMIGLADRFGLSGECEELKEYFGLSVKRIVEEAERLWQRPTEGILAPSRV